MKTIKNFVLSFIYLLISINLNAQSLCDTYGSSGFDLQITNGSYSSYGVDGLKDKKIRISGTFTIDQDYSPIKDAVFYMDPGSRIVAIETTLYMNNCKFYNCTPNQKWQGFVISGRRPVTMIDSKVENVEECFKVRNGTDVHIQDSDFYNEVQGGRVLDMLETRGNINDISGCTINGFDRPVTIEGSSFFTMGRLSNQPNIIENAQTAIWITGHEVHPTICCIENTEIHKCVRALRAFNSSSFEPSFNVHFTGLGKDANPTISDVGIGFVMVNGVFGVSDTAMESVSQGFVFDSAILANVDNCKIVNQVPTTYLGTADPETFYMVRSHNSRTNITNSDFDQDLGSNDQIFIEDNFVKVENVVLSSPDLTGIYANGAYLVAQNNELDNSSIIIENGSNPRIISNQIDAGSNLNGIRISMSPEAKVCYNVLPEANANLVFFDNNCMNTELSTNSFGSAFVGLRVNDVIGLQDRKGNEWNGTYPIQGAFYTGSNHLNSLFRAHSSDFPPSFSPIGWFDDVPSEEIFPCQGIILPSPPNGIGELSDIGIKVIRGIFQSTEVSIWKATQVVFDQIRTNPSLLTDPEIADWYDDQVGTNTEWIVLMNDAISNSHDEDLSEDIATEYDDLLTIVENIGTSTTQQDYDNQIASLQVLIDQYQTNKTNMLTSAEYYRSLIVPANIMDILLKEVAAVSIKKKQQGQEYVLSPTETTMIQEAANRCPGEYGYGVYMARTLNGTMDRSQYIDDCTAFNNRSIGGYEAVSHKVTIYPNPTKAMVVIEGVKPGTEISIYDLNGRQVWSDTSHQIDTRGWNDGVYIVRGQDIDGNTFAEKLIKN